MEHSVVKLCMPLRNNRSSMSTTKE